MAIWKGTTLLRGLTITMVINHLLNGMILQVSNNQFLSEGNPRNANHQAKKVNEPGVSFIVVVAAEFLTSQRVQGRFHKWFGTRLGCENFVYGKIKGYFGHDHKTDIVLYILFTLQFWLLRIVLYTLLWTNMSARWLGRRVSWISGTCDRSLEGYPPPQTNITIKIPPWMKMYFL